MIAAEGKGITSTGPIGGSIGSGLVVVAWVRCHVSFVLMAFVYLFKFTLTNETRSTGASRSSGPIVLCSKAPGGCRVTSVGIRNIGGCRSCMLVNLSKLSMNRSVSMPNSRVADTVGHC